MFYIKIVLLLILNTLIHAETISINKETKSIDILSNSQIYIDKTKKIDIQQIDEYKDKFVNNDKKVLGFGYSPDFNVWIRFTLFNNSKKSISKIIEYDNSLTTHIIFYDSKKPNIKQEQGLYFKNSDKNTVNPNFNIYLEANESRTFYIKASSHITTLIVKLNLWDSDTFFDKEIKHQIILALFFGAMFILGIYNLFIFFFTKDSSYLYYVIYIFGIIIHHLLYVGMANSYFLDSNQMIKTIEMASIVVAIPVLALAFFTKSFLTTEQYPIHNKLLNVFLILIPTSILFFLITDDFDKYRNIITMILLVYLMYLTLFAAIKKNKQAYFILFGWIIFVASGLLMFISSAGLFNIHQYIPYLIETSFVLEAIVFSIALANRINSLQKEKDDANKELILQQKNETSRLSKAVEEKTKHLKKALGEKDLLLKELNHRVKNNMQTIVSLIRLQNDELEDEKLQDVLLTIQNRINAMSHLHELLYRQDDITHINTYEYFEILIEEIVYSYEKNVDINLSVESNLQMEQAIYCGLILNELLTNSFKYAFINNEGKIKIELTRNNDMFMLRVQDNGVGFKEINNTNSLGLTLVKTLVHEQLEGDITINSNKGVETIIKW